LLNLDLITNSDLYLEERISASETVVEAYRAGTKAQFIQQALALIKVYLKCQKK